MVLLLNFLFIYIFYLVRNGLCQYIFGECPVIAGHLREREKYKLVFHCGASRAGVHDGCAYERKTLIVIILSIVPWDSSVIQRTI